MIDGETVNADLRRESQRAIAVIGTGGMAVLETLRHDTNRRSVTVLHLVDIEPVSAL